MARDRVLGSEISHKHRYLKHAYIFFNLKGGDTIAQHSSHPKTSSETVKVDDIGVLGAGEQESGMIQAHGETTDTKINILILLTGFHIFLFM